MSGKRNLLALGVAIALGVAGAASSAQAGSERDDVDSGGYRIGPLGQVFGGSSDWRGAPQGGYAYGFASPVHTHHHLKKTNSR
jgi:hypothetical protein